MRVLILWADDRSPNLGVRALGAGTAALVRGVWPRAEVVHHSYGSRVTPVPMGSVRSAAKELLTSRGGVVDWLRGFDVVIDTRAGDSFADIYGLERLVVQNLMSEAVRRSGTPLVLGPQTIGPFRTARGRWLGKRALGQAAVVLARDSASAERAAGLGRPATAVVTDVVFALDQPEAAAPHDVVLNVSGLLWNTDAHGDSAAYRQAVVGIARALLAQGREVALLAHVLASSKIDNDEAVLPEVISSVGADLEILVPDSLNEVRAMVAGARLTIGSRMHACLNSLSTGTPAIPLAYSDKFTPLFADLAWPYVVDLRASSDPAADVLRLVDSPDLAERALRVRALADARIEASRTALLGIHSNDRSTL